jgi:hypothetical protein
MEIPENVRQTLAVVAKYHFWILAALVPAIALPVLWVGNDGLTAKIGQQRQKIQSTLGQISSVTGVSPHPNATLRTWPADLGDDFLPAVASLAPNGRLERKFLLRYQKLVPRFARSLPTKMGVKEEMVGVSPPPGQPPGAAQRPGVPPAAAGFATTWNAADQKTLYDSFVWDVPPSTTQVLAAQEELWVYAALCDLLGQFNQRKQQPGGRTLPIASINELAVGYRAAKSSMAAAESKRILIPVGGEQVAAEGGPVDAGGEPPPGEDPSAAGGEAAVNPRFEPGTKVTDENAYRNLIYVDFNGRPLTAAQLDTVPDAKMLHLVPFVFKGVVDQRELDALLVALGSAGLPIDVRQVRINAGASGGPAAGGGGQPGPGGPAQARRYDVQVEVRGTVALATRPEKAAIGAAAAPPPEEGA